MTFVWTKSEKQVNEIIVRQPSIKAANMKQAKKIAARAEKTLAKHRQEGHAKIETSQGDVDAFASLVDEAALSIEFGHFQGARGKRNDGKPPTYVPGLHIMRRSAHK